jgi:enamine deaminase RidA (YjgF/YER057c/UK114 family)
MVMVFDASGQQMSEYQGVWDEVREKVLAAKPAGVEVEFGEWNRTKERGDG